MLINDIEERDFSFIESSPDILGGKPVIKGTRIDVASVKARLAGGDTLETLAADYPDVPIAAFEAARKYSI